MSITTIAGDRAVAHTLVALLKLRISVRGG
jgi:hypothetical protein